MKQLAVFLPPPLPPPLDGMLVCCPPPAKKNQNTQDSLLCSKHGGSSLSQTHASSHIFQNVSNVFFFFRTNKLLYDVYNVECVSNGLAMQEAAV